MGYKMKITLEKRYCFIIFLSVTLFSSFKTTTVNNHPKIVNIINFIRLLAPRDSSITEEVLYQTVVNQVQLMTKYHLGGTFLLQYDALLDPRYQNLLKKLPRDKFEIGAWWEIPQPLVENAGLVWRGLSLGLAGKHRFFHRIYSCRA
jgi:hypothetical protein